MRSELFVLSRVTSMIALTVFPPTFSHLIKKSLISDNESHIDSTLCFDYFFLFLAGISAFLPSSFYFRFDHDKHTMEKFLPFDKRPTFILLSILKLQLYPPHFSAKKLHE